MPVTKFARSILVAAAALGLAACGQTGGAGGSDEGNGGGGGGAMAGQLRAACTTQIENLGVLAGAVDQVCECATSRAQDQLSVTDLVSGNTAALEDIVAQCVDESLGFGGGNANTNGTED